MSNHSPLVESVTRAAFAFGGPMGERISANQINWLLAAPTANPAMLSIFNNRDLPQFLLPWSGEYAGKYLISGVQGLRLTGDQHLREELQTLVDTLIRYQGSDGYLGPFPQQQRMNGRDPFGHAQWDLWGQYHCMLGLYYWYKETDDVAALHACTRAANLFCQTFLGNTFLETDVAEWNFSRKDGPTIAEHLKLLPGGAIGGYSHPNEARWAFEGPVLVFYAQNGAASTRFTLFDPNTNTYTGEFLFDPSITHVLKQVYFPATVQNQACAHIFALLYRETGDARYLQLLHTIEAAWHATGGDYVQGFQHNEEFYANGAARRWESLHSVQAVAELYFLTGDEQYSRAFQRIWSSIRERDRHNTGGFSSLEQATGNPYDPRPIETCATIAWLALTLDMLRLTGDSKVADELELTTWNAMLGAQSPDGRWWTYNTPMGGVPTDGMPVVALPPPLGFKPPSFAGERHPSRFDLQFQDATTRGTSLLSCCSANGPRGIGMLSEWAVMAAADGGITINFYGPSCFTVRSPLGRDVSLVQETDYPAGGRIILSVIPAAQEQFRLRLRIPGWSQNTTVSLNGTGMQVVPGAYLAIDHVWTAGDKVELLFDMRPRFVVGGPPPPGADPQSGNTTGRVSVYHGPLLLAYDARLNSLAPPQMPPLLQSVAPTPVPAQMGAPALLLRLQFSTTSGAITLCDFASAGWECRPAPPQRPNPFLGWRFSRGDGSVIAAHIHLQNDGSISGYSHPNEARWGFEGDTLVLYAQNGAPSTRFQWVSADDGRLVLRGVFLFDRRIVHVLTQDDSNDWGSVWQFWRADGTLLGERVLLMANGSIGGYQSPNEVRWDTATGALTFYAQDGRPSTCFGWTSKENGLRVLRGVFRFDASITHVLKEVDSGIDGKSWDYVRLGPGAQETRIASGVRLLSGGVISGYSHPNEARWGLEGDALVFYTDRGAASTRFTSLLMQHGRPTRRGQFLLDPGLTHELRAIDSQPANKLWRFVRKWPVNPPGAIDLRLLANSVIDGADHPNESRWSMDGSTLEFLAANGTVSTRFTEMTAGVAGDIFDFRGVADLERRMIRSGVFEFDHAIRHELRESNIDLGWTAGSAYISWLPVSGG